MGDDDSGFSYGVIPIIFLLLLTSEPACALLSIEAVDVTALVELLYDAWVRHVLIFQACRAGHDLADLRNNRGT